MITNGHNHRPTHGKKKMRIKVQTTTTLRFRAKLNDTSTNFWQWHTVSIIYSVQGDFHWEKNVNVNKILLSTFDQWKCNNFPSCMAFTLLVYHGNYWTPWAHGKPLGLDFVCLIRPMHWSKVLPCLDIFCVTSMMSTTTPWRIQQMSYGMNVLRL